MQVYILLATYNGELYIDEQIESIRNQTYQDWRLLIRDDGSTDNTTELLNYKSQNDPRIHLVSDDLNNIGVIANFSRLAEIALADKADYVFFCDQDDIWLADKLENTLTEMLNFERASNKTTPLLIHTDLEVINEKNELIHHSFLKYQHLSNVVNKPLEVLLAQNFVTGSTAAINNALLKIATPIKSTAIMHDWWYALTAATYGRLVFIDKPTVKYRQHNSNVVGSTGYNSKFNVLTNNFTKTIEWNRVKIHKSCLQACSVYNMIPSKPPATRKCQKLYFYCNMANTEYNLMTRIKYLFLSGAHKQGILRNILFFYQAIIEIILNFPSHDKKL